MDVPASSLIGSLPVPRTRLIGREAEQETARTLLLDNAVPLLTLTGTGGVGKTRLALEIAQDAASSFADGVVWGDLAPILDPALVPLTLANMLEFVPTPGRSVSAELARYLRPRQMLLLLDNCEHLAHGVADLVAILLGACPALQILATSRAPLRLRGEQLLPVEPLSIPPEAASRRADVAAHASVRLFVERAQAVRPAFQLADANAATISTLCRQLEGLPLAIELSAARISLLSPEAQLAQMSDRLALLRGGVRDAPPRQRTMRDTIAWSYGLLAPAKQVVLRRLAVFVGGFSLHAAAAVCEMPHERAIDAIDELASLAEHHLIRPLADVQHEPRFTMFEMVREFALEQLAASGEAEAVRRRHAEWCLRLAEQAERPMMGGPEQAGWLVRLETELPNLRVALEWLDTAGDPQTTLRLAGALSGIWFHRSHPEGAAWLERALAAAETTPSPGRGKALRSLALLGMSMGRENAVELAAESVAVWSALGDAWRAAEARMVLGQILEYRTDYARAMPLLEAAAAEWDAFGEPDRAAVALYFLGQAALDHEDCARAEALFEDAMGRFRRGSVTWLASLCLHQLGEVAATRGEIAVAAAYYAESLVEVGPRENQVGKLVATGRLAAVGGQAETAARILGAAEALAGVIGYVRRPPEQKRLDRDTAVARSALGDFSFEAAWAAGAALSTEHALAEARAVLAILRDPAAHDREGDRVVSLAPAPSGNLDARAILTYREQEVLALLCQRLTDAEIGARLFLSKRTVEHHVSSILGKLGVTNRRQAAAVAARNHLV